MPIDSLLLLRHAEKPDAREGVAGVDEAGRPDSDSLSVRGWQRAGAIAVWLAGPSAPTAIWAAPSTSNHPSRRPEQTVLPLSRVCGLPLRRLPEEEGEAASVQALLASEGRRVYCGRHGALPALGRAIAVALGAAVDQVPPHWPADRFDLAWRFARDRRTGTWAFRVLPQTLLDGDAGPVVRRTAPRRPGP